MPDARYPTMRRLMRGATVGLVLAIAVAVVGGIGPTAAQTGQVPVPMDLDVPYVPTPNEIVERMLRLADVGPGDRLIDLGSGDGRIPIAAAKRFGIQALGVDIDPTLVDRARANAKAAGVDDKVTFEVKDLFETPIGEATVLMLYLLPDVNLLLRPRVLSELKPGSRVVSHQFDMGDWQPTKAETIGRHKLFLWIIPER